MTRAEIELVAIALYESQARVIAQTPKGEVAMPWRLNTAEDRELWRRRARLILSEATSE